MKKVSFDTRNGYLLLDGIMMAPLNESDFIKIAKENDIEAIQGLECQTNHARNN